VTRSEDKRMVTLSPAGVPVAVGLVEETDIDVLVRPDPAKASAAEIVDMLGLSDPEEWHADAAAWFAAQPDAPKAADALVGEITAEERDLVIVAIGLQAVDAVVGEHAEPAIRSRQGGPHDGMVLHWLLDRGVIGPGSIDPMRIALSWVDVLATSLDIGGPEELVTGLESDQHVLTETLGHIWRLDHPRLEEVLEVIGAHHPAKPVAKAARRALMKHRSR
jgi:hypothetical protein